ncbi:50S ribosomal protein L24 [Sulfurimonas sp. SAG-AH-194-C21]|nr:50S ribosomal protein L24 [Sulfurimonas sp. SAG-AH-194-C21]MDF1882465.1 50S ribosomal protein L24 [Sulfurimonas sp. SAG-AH-194-C21]
MAKLNFKKGDTVEIIAGDDRGTKAVVVEVLVKKNKVIVEGCKIAKKAVKPTEENAKGGHINKEMPIDISNVRKVEA